MRRGSGRHTWGNNSAGAESESCPDLPLPLPIAPWAQREPRPKGGRPPPPRRLYPILLPRPLWSSPCLTSLPLLLSLPSSHPAPSLLPSGTFPHSPAFALSSLRQVPALDFLPICCEAAALPLLAGGGGGGFWVFPPPGLAAEGWEAQGEGPGLAPFPICQGPRDPGNWGWGAAQGSSVWQGHGQCVSYGSGSLCGSEGRPELGACWSLPPSRSLCVCALVLSVPRNLLCDTLGD